MPPAYALNGRFGSTRDMSRAPLATVLRIQRSLNDAFASCDDLKASKLFLTRSAKVMNRPITAPQPPTVRLPERAGLLHRVPIA